MRTLYVRVFPNISGFIAMEISYPWEPVFRIQEQLMQRRYLNSMTRSLKNIVRHPRRSELPSFKTSQQMPPVGQGGLRQAKPIADPEKV